MLKAVARISIVCVAAWRRTAGGAVPGGSGSFEDTTSWKPFPKLRRPPQPDYSGTAKVRISVATACTRTSCAPAGTRSASWMSKPAAILAASGRS
jgi:hypothetical protein